MRQFSALFYRLSEMVSTTIFVIAQMDAIVEGTTKGSGSLELPRVWLGNPR
jgi:hypothetical protein